MNINEFIEKLNPKDNKIIFLVILVIAITVLIIILIVLINFLFNINVSTPSEPPRRSEAFLFEPNADDFKIPPEYQTNPEFIWRPFRTTPARWNEEEIERFWRDPTDVIIEVYSEENKKYIKEILEGIP